MSRELTLILSMRVWQAGAGLVTTLLAVHFLSPETQGWYYSFLSVASLYTLFDLGLSTVLVQVSAHAFVGLRWLDNRRVAGAGADYFHALVNRAARWYAICAVAFAILLVPGGLIFFGAKSGAPQHWALQWVLLCGVTASGLVVLPLMSVLEGTGRLAHVYAVRLIVAVCGSLACWATFASGAGLLATVMVPTMAFVIPAFWLVRSWRGLCSMARHQAVSEFDWRREVWPLQWRVAIGLLCGFAMTQINIPLLFHAQGAIVAGQLGLSLAIVNMIGLIAQSWITRRVPLMADAVARRDWATLDALFMRDFAASSGIFLLGAVVAIGFVAALSGTTYSHRILPAWQLAALFAYTFSNQLIAGLAAQLRSFRREPLMPLIAVTTLLTLPLNVWAIRHYSSAGLVTSLAAMNSLVALPIAVLVWRRCNRIWRNRK
jgi:hypothetical protein